MCGPTFKFQASGLRVELNVEPRLFEGSRQRTFERQIDTTMALPLSFLRPRALPRTSTINYFLRSASTAPSFATAISPERPYRIALTKSQQWPVYHLRKRGGNMHITTVKHIEGDIELLRTDLQEALGLQDAKDVRISQLTKQIIVKVCLCLGLLGAWV